MEGEARRMAKCCIVFQRVVVCIEMVNKFAMGKSRF